MNINEIAPAILTRNVTRVYRAATDEERAAGLAWYPDAQRHARNLALASAHYALTPRNAAGIIAALSPLNSWGANLNLAARLVEAGGLSSGYLGSGLRKANLLLGGADPEKVLTSQKVSAFFRGIDTAGKTDAVTIDRHAYSIAVGERDVNPRLTAVQYRAAADAYRRAARILSRDQGRILTAPEVQAVTWVAWRHRTWAAGAFDPR